MRKGIIISLLLLVIGDAIIVGASNADDSCYTHSTGYISLPSPNPIKSIPADSGESLGYIAWRTSFDVIESRKDSTGNCWLRIDRGWIRDDHVQPNKSRQSTRTNTTSSTQTKCYSASKAYITGAMNIRSGPGTSNRKVGSAHTGESFSVSRSQRGGEYCWLKVNKGWIAKTGRVSSTKPVVEAAKTCAGIPPLNGARTDRIRRAFDYLCKNAPNWFAYATSSRPSSISDDPKLPGGRAYPNGRRIGINTNAYPIIMVLASVIVHESCHIHQFNEGRWRGGSPLDVEVECHNKQLDFVRQVAPNGEWHQILLDKIKRLPLIYR